MVAHPRFQFEKDILLAKLPATTKLVALAIATYANGSGRAYPSIDLLAADCSVSEKTIRRAIGTLRGEGFIGVASMPGRAGKHNVYTLSGGQETSKNKQTTSKLNRSSGGGGAVTHDRFNRSPMTAEQTIEQTIEHSATAHSPDGRARSRSEDKIKSSREGEPWLDDPDRLEIVRDAAKRYLDMGIISDAWVTEILSRCATISSWELEEVVTEAFTSNAAYWRDACGRVA